MKVRVIIIDDEPLAREGIRVRLDKHNAIEIISEIDSGTKAVQAIKKEKPDLIFLDVQMPGLDGFDVLQQLDPNEMPVVIFVTAYDCYALDAFRAHALDYLLKPIEDERFQQSLERALMHIQQKRFSAYNEKIQHFLGALDDFKAPHNVDRPPEKLERVAIKSRGRVLFFKVQDIEWIEAAGDYVHLHIKKEKHLLRETISFFEERLPEDVFQRIHRSTIVNLDCIKELRSNDMGDQVVYLHDNTKLKLGRTYRAKLQNAVGPTF